MVGVIFAGPYISHLIRVMGLRVGTMIYRLKAATSKLLLAPSELLCWFSLFTLYMGISSTLLVPLPSYRACLLTIPTCPSSPLNTIASTIHCWWVHLFTDSGLNGACWGSLLTSTSDYLLHCLLPHSHHAMGSLILLMRSQRGLFPLTLRLVMLLGARKAHCHEMRQTLLLTLLVLLTKMIPFQSLIEQDSPFLSFQFYLFNIWILCFSFMWDIYFCYS